jgi:uncharacterized membrane protein YqhA
MIKKLEGYFESLLWESRLVVLAAVVGSLLAGLAMFYMATIDAWYTIVHLGDYASSGLPAAERNLLRSATITHVVEIVDGYLLATVMLIFALGLYELFISKIDKAAQAETSSKVLVIESLDDLKARLGKVVLMILIVKFFEYAVEIKFASAIELLYLAGGIALIGVALYLSHAGDHGKASETE